MSKSVNYREQEVIQMKIETFNCTWPGFSKTLTQQFVMIFVVPNVYQDIMPSGLYMRSCEWWTLSWELARVKRFFKCRKKMVVTVKNVYISVLLDLDKKKWKRWWMLQRIFKTSPNSIFSIGKVTYHQKSKSYIFF